MSEITPWHAEGPVNPDGILGALYDWLHQAKANDSFGPERDDRALWSAEWRSPPRAKPWHSERQATTEFSQRLASVAATTLRGANTPGAGLFARILLGTLRGGKAWSRAMPPMDSERKAVEREGAAAGWWAPPPP